MPHSSAAKLDALTTGPSSHTASELMPMDIVSRAPATRERMRSSTLAHVIASVNGIEPKMKIITPSSRTSSHQPCACAASASSGICASAMAQVQGLERQTVDEPAHHHLRQRGHGIDRGQHRAQQRRILDDASKTLVSAIAHCRWW